MQFNKFFVHKIKPDVFVLITDAGNWVKVSESELGEVKAGKPGNVLFKKLEEKKIILTDKNKEALTGDYKNLFDHLTHGISLHIINPTMACNHSCHYCYANAPAVGAKGVAMSKETAKKTVDFIWQSPMKNIVIEFQGGEPLANFPIIQFIMDYTKTKRPKKTVHWRMVSNLSLMDETIAAWCKKNSLLDICTSLDGPKEVHDKNRPMPGGSHAKVVHWINSLKNDFGFERIGTLCTVTKNSLPFAKEIVDQYLDLNLPDITPVSIRQIGRAKQNWQNIGYKPEQYLKFWKSVLNECIESTLNGKYFTEQFSMMIAQKLSSAKPAFHTCFSKPCGAALMQASYQPDGSIYTCDEGKAEELFKLGTVEQKYADVFASQNALNMVSISSSLGMICNECKWTAFCSFCPVMAYASQGSLVPLLYNNADCVIRKGQFSTVFEKLFSPEKKALNQWLGPSKAL